MVRSAFNRFAVIAAFIGVVFVNYITVVMPFNGITIEEISDSYPTLFTPAGFTFSIWGIIYTALLGFVIFQALPAQKTSAVLAKISSLFIINCAANAVWVIIWQLGYLWMSLLVMGVILLTLLRIYQIIKSSQPPRSWKTWLLLHLPFSLYLGWIVCASIANLSVVQYANGWSDAGLSAVQWTFLKLGLAGAIGLWAIWRKGDIVFMLVIAWAAFGIHSQQAGTPVVAKAAASLSILACLCAAISAFQKIRR